MGDVPVDIVIATYNRGAHISATVDSILRNSYQDFTLWILDQSDDEVTECCVRSAMMGDRRIRYLRVPHRGISATRNHGATLGTAPIILFTNDDCTVSECWIEGLLAEFTDPGIWFAFGRVLPAAKRCSDDAQVVLALKISAKHQIYRNRLKLGFGHGHNMAVRRDRFTALGGFDLLLGAGGPLGSWDERDLGYRALMMGGAIVYTPTAVVHHDHWQSWSAALGSYRNYGIGVGAAVAKYLRCGDMFAVFILIEWFFSQGLRQIVSGLLKWRSWGKVALGLSQFVYPWVGLGRSLRYTCDHKGRLYLGR